MKPRPIAKIIANTRDQEIDSESNSDHDEIKKANCDNEDNNSSPGNVQCKTEYSSYFFFL